MTNPYLSLALEDGTRIDVYRDDNGVRAVLVPASGVAQPIDDLLLDDGDETLTRLRARSLQMWLCVRDRGVVGGMLCGDHTSGTATYR